MIFKADDSVIIVVLKNAVKTITLCWKFSVLIIDRLIIQTTESIQLVGATYNWLFT